MSQSQHVSATRTIAAPVARVFAVLADPVTHAAIDGTGWVQESVDRAPLTEVGQIFRMEMYHSGHPDGDYRVVNKVQVLDPPRAIGWLTGQQKGDGELEFGGWLWRYDLAPLGPSETEVTLSYDWSAVPQYIRDRGIHFPPFGPEHLGNSLHHLAELAGEHAPAEAVEVAQRLADEVLFPAAVATDASDIIPVELLDAVAGAGLYGIIAPPEAGGRSADFGTVCAVQEALASGCLTTGFLWAQHVGLVRAITASSDEALRDRWLKPLASGAVRAGLALGGALPKPALRAVPDGAGWLLEGVSPFVSGWGRIDVLHAAARTPDDEIVWLIVDAAEGEHVRAERLRLAALNATCTVRVSFDALPVPGDRVTGRYPAGGVTPPEVLRMHAALALGVAARCCRMLGPTALDAELSALREELDRLGPQTAEARARAGELAVRAAEAVMTAEGSRSLLASGQAQRLAREALFTLVYALRPASRAEVLTGLGAPELA